LNIFLTRIGDFPGAVAIAQRSIIVAHQIASPGAIATGEWMLGVSYHLLGDQAAAQRHCERGLAEAETSDTHQIVFFGYDHRVRALIALARCLWLGGFPDRAAMTARRAIDEAVKHDHPVNLCIAMIYSATVFLWRGDLDEAEHFIERLVAHASRHSLRPYHTIGLALSGELAVARGDPSVGVRLLRRALALLQQEQYNVLTPAFYRAIAEGLMQLGENDEAAATLDAALTRSEAYNESLNVPELLRVRGELWLRAKPADPASAERAFQLSVQQAKAQSAPSLELRSTMGLARLWASQGKTAEAGGLLETVYRRFAEGFETTDLKLAAQLMVELGRHITLLDAASGAI
jgi:ATP/maltotriose-dependent transcriptional regulator MalT